MLVLTFVTNLEKIVQVSGSCFEDVIPFQAGNCGTWNHGSTYRQLTLVDVD